MMMIYELSKHSDGVWWHLHRLKASIKVDTHTA